MNESPRLLTGALRSVDLPRGASLTTGSQLKGNLMPPKKAQPGKTRASKDTTS